MTNVLDEHLVVAESVLDRESDAIGREDLRGDLSGPCAAGRFRRYDRRVMAERMLMFFEEIKNGRTIASVLRRAS